ncbi:MAG: hypothetical protein ACYTHJ_19155 [Planctomycetota bacterium]
MFTSISGQRFASPAFSIAVLILCGRAVAEDRGWPRTFKDISGEVTIFQPQVESWEGRTVIELKAAVAVLPPNEKEPNLGILDYKAKTRVNHDEQTVLITEPETSFTFPGLDEDEARFLTSICRIAVPEKESMVVSLDRLVAGVSLGEAQAREIEVNLEPPPIFYSDVPAILINFMGEPSFETIEGTNLLFATNTNWDLFMETGSSRYFLLVGEGWIGTKDLIDGPWNPAPVVAADLAKLPDDENWSEVKKHLPSTPVTPVPRVFVSQEPAELIMTSGKPELSPIPDTDLMYVTNTECDLFLHNKENQYYFLVAGRWFRAKEVKGPWTPATKDLPETFAEIPENHETSDVLASVPGTEEAEEAIIKATIPKKATVKRSEVSIEVKYKGEPEFQVIEGSKDVYYAANTPNSVFRVDEAFYCCDNGIWFCAESAMGPWLVCSSVPDKIYSIPVSSPYHNVTYVYIYDDDDDDVVVGYTSGYTGGYIAYGAVMFGAGYWLGRHDDWDDWWGWHHSPCFYSYGIGARYSFYHGGFRRGVGYYGPYGGAGFGARYNPWTGTFARGAYAYGPRGAAGVGRAYNPWTGTRARGGFVSGPRGTAGRARVYNPRTGTGMATRQVNTPYGSWGRSVVRHGDDWARFGHRSGPAGTTIAGKNSGGGKGFVHKGDRGWTYGKKTRSGDVFVGHDGSLYRVGNDNNWYRHNNKNRDWQRTDWKHDRTYRNNRVDGNRVGGSRVGGARVDGNRVERRGTTGDRSSARRNSPSQKQDARGARPNDGRRNDNRQAQRNRQPQQRSAQRSHSSRSSYGSHHLNRASRSRSRGSFHSTRRSSHRSGGGRRGGRR